MDHFETRRRYATTGSGGTWRVDYSRNGRAPENVHCRPTLVGLRGVGKTVLLNKLADIAEKSNFRIAIVDAQEGKTLPEFLLPHERRVTPGALIRAISSSLPCEWLRSGIP